MGFVLFYSSKVVRLVSIIAANSNSSAAIPMDFAAEGANKICSSTQETNSTEDEAFHSFSQQLRSPKPGSYVVVVMAMPGKPIGTCE